MVSYPTICEDNIKLFLYIHHQIQKNFHKRTDKNDNCTNLQRKLIQELQNYWNTLKLLIIIY